MKQKPENCEFSYTNGVKITCPMVGEDGYFIIAICPDNCPIVVLTKRVDELEARLKKTANHRHPELMRFGGT